MGLAHSPRIVTNGLVLCLDAGNTKSYPGSGTTWIDISRNGNNGTLTNGPTFSSANTGSIVFDGTNDFVSIPNFTYRFNTSFTLSIWIRFIALTTLPTTLISNYSGTITGNDGVFLEINASNAVRFVYRNLGVDVFDFASGAVTINTTYNIVATVSNTGGAKLYINSQQLPLTSGVSSLFTPTNTTLVINRLDSATGRYTNSNTYLAAVYNRALSATEVAQNFNALRGRFGI